MSVSSVSAPTTHAIKPHVAPPKPKVKAKPAAAVAKPATSATTAKPAASTTATSSVNIKV